MTKQVNTVASYFGICGKGNHIDPGGACLRCDSTNFLAKQRAEKKRRADLIAAGKDPDKA